MAADTGMDTCPSPEITDSRKRPLDGDSENGDVKRSHFSSVQDLVTALPLANGHGNITSHFAIELINSLLQVKQRRRLSADRALAHAWLCGAPARDDLAALDARLRTNYLTHFAR